MGDYQEIRTERLLMRRWRDSDRGPFADLNADPEVMRYFPAPQDRAESDRAMDGFERRFEEQGYGLWALEVLASREFIGFTGLNPMPDGVPGAGDLEVGWRLVRRVWHHGYATEAARAALDVGLVHLGLPVIWSMTAVLNRPSQAVMQRLGMVRYATFEHPRVEVATHSDHTSSTASAQTGPCPRFHPEVDRWFTCRRQMRTAAGCVTPHRQRVPGQRRSAVSPRRSGAHDDRLQRRDPPPARQRVPAGP